MPESAGRVKVGGTVVWSGHDEFGIRWNSPLAFEFVTQGFSPQKPPGDNGPDIGMRSTASKTIGRTDDTLENLRNLFSRVCSTLATVASEKDDLHIEEVLRQIAHFARANCCGVFLLSEDQKSFPRLCSLQADTDTPGFCPGPGAFPWVAETVRRGKPVVWSRPEDLPEHAGAAANPFVRRGIESQLMLPLSENGKVFGALILESTEGRPDWSDTILEPLKLISSVVVLALNHQRTRNALEHNRQFWESLLDTFPVPVFYKDTSGRYQNCNSAFARRILGLPKERIIGSTLYNLQEQIPTRLANTYHRHDLALMRDGGTQVYEAKVRCADGGERDFLFTKAVYLTKEGRTAGIVGVMLDISKRKQTEEALKRSEERFRRLFEDAVLGIFQSTLDGHLINVNPALAGMFGYHSPEELIASVDDVSNDLYANPTDRTRIVENLIESEEAVKSEIHFRRRDGGVFTGNLHIWKVRDEKERVLYFEGFIEDISERKQVEENLRDSESRLRLLSSRLLAAEEDLRKRISMEIHDDLGQNLAVLKLHLQSLSNRLRKDQAGLKHECGETLQFIDQIIEKTRKITRDLSPSIIQDLKLCGTLQWMVREFRRHTDIRISLEMDDIDGCFDEEAQIVIYRIFQEALNNIVKHAAANKVAICIRQKTDRVAFIIKDNGRGFELNAVWRRHVAERGLGLAAMDERARMLGGALDIASRKQKGTRIVLQLPVRYQERPQ